MRQVIQDRIQEIENFLKLPDLTQNAVLFNNGKLAAYQHVRNELRDEVGFKVTAEAILSDLGIIREASPSLTPEEFRELVRKKFQE